MEQSFVSGIDGTRSTKRNNLKEIGTNTEGTQ